MNDAQLFAVDNFAVERMGHLSPLMRAKAKSKDGARVNACPFGCVDEDIDGLDYCHHVVGFTSDGKTYEVFLPPGPDGRRVVDGRQRRRVERGDKLVVIAAPHCRVYRDVPKPPPRSLVEAEGLEADEPVTVPPPGAVRPPGA